MPYDIDKIRKQLKQKLSTRPQDPFEFRPPKAKEGEVIKIRFFILPPLMKGDKVYGGLCSRDMEMFAIKHGSHWINNRPYACPRMNNDEQCELCEAGFEMLKQTQDKEKRAAIVRQWLAQSVYTVNIYFPNFSSTPEELRGKVMFYHAPKTCFDQWYAAVNRDAPVQVEGDEPNPDPEAYGVFFDESAAFLYQLEITPSGSYNSYKTSKFLASLGPQPIIKAKEGAPDSKRIQAILDQRHDLWTKIEDADPAKIHRLCQQMLHGADVDDDETPGGGQGGKQGADAGSTVAEGEEVETPAPAPARPTQPARPATKAATTQPARPATKAATTQPARPATQPAPKPATTQKVAPADDVMEEELPPSEDEGTADEGSTSSEGVEEETAPVAAKPAPAKALAKPAAKPTPSKPAAKPAPAKPAARAAAPAPARKTQPVVETDDEGDDNIDGLLAKLTPGGGALAEEEAPAE